MSDKYQLTPVEFKLREILWKIDSVRDVIDHLSTKRESAYTSVSTNLRIMQHTLLKKLFPGQ